MKTEDMDEYQMYFAFYKEGDEFPSMDDFLAWVGGLQKAERVSADCEIASLKEEVASLIDEREVWKKIAIGKLSKNIPGQMQIVDAEDYES